MTRYRVVCECVVDADTEQDAKATVTLLLDDGMTRDIVIATVEECEPTQRELENASWWAA